MFILFAPVGILHESVNQLAPCRSTTLNLAPEGITAIPATTKIPFRSIPATLLATNVSRNGRVLWTTVPSALNLTASDDQLAGR
jgi:hypothetical protein